MMDVTRTLLSRWRRVTVLQTLKTITRSFKVGQRPWDRSPKKAFITSQHPESRPPSGWVIRSMMPDYLLVYPRPRKLPALSEVWASLARSDLVTSLSSRSLVSTLRHNHTSSLSPASVVNNLNKVTSTPDNIQRSHSKHNKLYKNVYKFCDS